MTVNPALQDTFIIDHINTTFVVTMVTYSSLSILSCSVQSPENGKMTVFWHCKKATPSFQPRFIIAYPSITSIASTVFE